MRPHGAGTTPGTAEADEADLVARLRAREEAAFEQLVRVYGPRMLSVARRFLPDDSDAQDALQDAFVSVFRSIPGFSGGSRLSTWLHRIVVNASLMKIRSRKRRPAGAIDALPVELGDTGGDRPTAEWALSAAEAMATREMRTRVRECIARIPEAYRTVLLLRDIEGMPVRDVGNLLGISPGTVKMRLHRARHALRGLLDPYMRGDAA
jgi:RNA polymerase sigma-70 factor, ECF subfamily